MICASGHKRKGVYRDGRRPFSWTMVREGESMVVRERGESMGEALHGT